MRPIVFAYVETIIGIGVAAYLYKEFLWDRLRRRNPYVVQDVKKLNGTVAQVTLRGGRASRWRIAPGSSCTSISLPTRPSRSRTRSRSARRRMRAICGCRSRPAAIGPSTCTSICRSGAAAYVDGPYGEFNFRKGSPKQVWIAAGIGITPFMSWMRDFETTPCQRPGGGGEIDFFYTTTVPEEALFLDEIEKAKAARPVFAPTFRIRRATGG